MGCCNVSHCKENLDKFVIKWKQFCNEFLQCTNWRKVNIILMCSSEIAFTALALAKLDHWCLTEEVR